MHEALGQWIWMQISQLDNNPNNDTEYQPGPTPTVPAQP